MKYLCRILYKLSTTITTFKITPLNMTVFLARYIELQIALSAYQIHNNFTSVIIITYFTDYKIYIQQRCRQCVRVGDAL